VADHRCHRVGISDDHGDLHDLPRFLLGRTNGRTTKIISNQSKATCVLPLYSSELPVVPGPKKGGGANESKLCSKGIEVWPTVSTTSQRGI
jgi:hypothetical protein